MNKPNATTRAAMKEAREMNKNAIKTTNMNTLGVAQQLAENAAKELRLANAALEKAQQRVADATEAHENAQRTLMAEVNALRNATRVTPFDLR